jgi:hypothetical protein
MWICHFRGNDSASALEYKPQISPLSVRKQNCHPDRSVAKWRDLQFSGPLLEMFYDKA